MIRNSNKVSFRSELLQDKISQKNYAFIGLRKKSQDASQTLIILEMRKWELRRDKEDGCGYLILQPETARLLPSQV